MYIYIYHYIQWNINSSLRSESKVNYMILIIERLEYNNINFPEDYKNDCNINILYKNLIKQSQILMGNYFLCIIRVLMPIISKCIYDVCV